MYPAYGGANQLWKWGADNTLVSKMGLVAGFQYVGVSEGANCVGWTPVDNQNQRWRYENNEMKSTLDDSLVMDITDSERKTGVAARVKLQKGNGSSNQKWNLVPEKHFSRI